jgi:hypothetical protein
MDQHPTQSGIRSPPAWDCTGHGRPPTHASPNTLSASPSQTSHSHWIFHQHPSPEGGRILAVGAVAVKHTKQVAALVAAAVAHLDEQLVLVLLFEGAEPNVLDASRLGARGRGAGRQQGHKRQQLRGLFNARVIIPNVPPPHGLLNAATSDQTAASCGRAVA